MTAAYRCLDCAWSGHGGGEAVAHHGAQRHHRIVDHAGQPQPFGCCLELAGGGPAPMTRMTLPEFCAYARQHELGTDDELLRFEQEVRTLTTFARPETLDQWLACLEAWHAASMGERRAR